MFISNYNIHIELIKNSHAWCSNRVFDAVNIIKELHAYI